MTTPQPVLDITDGTTRISLLSRGYGFHLREWTPTIPDPKGGGVFVSSPLVDGRRLMLRKLDNIIDTMDIVINAPSQNQAILHIQNLRRLLTKAHQYWTTEWQNEPVWIEARGAYETNRRYATIVDWRLQTDDNPYSQPFFSESTSTMNDLSLAIEHEYWLATRPSSSQCVEISSQSVFSAWTTGTFYPTASTDDAYITVNTGAIDTSGDVLKFIGYDPADWADAGIRFRSVTIPADSEIAEARVYLAAHTDGDPVDDYSDSAIVSVENNVSPAAFSTFDDFTTRKTNSVSPGQTWYIREWKDGGVYATPDISTAIEALVGKAGWSSGNDAAVFLTRNSGAVDPFEASSYDFSTLERASLVVSHRSTGTLFGREATCGSGVYVANKGNAAQLTHWYHYDSSLTTWTNLTGATLPYNLLPSGATTGDGVYFGIQAITTDSGPFSSLVLDIGTAMAGGPSGSWTYWNGATWANLNPNDQTEEFINEGIQSINWEQPNDWATNDPGMGVTGYWIRYEISSGTATTLPQQQGRQPYTAVLPYVDIDSDQIDGDVDALAAISIKNESYSSASGADELQTGGVHIGVRSLDRGEYFHAYFNASDEQHSVGKSASVSGNTTFGNDPGGTVPASPTGRLARYFLAASADTTFNTEVLWTVASPYSGHYIGRYRALLRYAQTAGSSGDISARLGYFAAAPVEFTDPVTLPKPGSGNAVQVIELGQISFFTGNTGAGEIVGDFSLALQLTNSNASGTSVYIYDVILIPYDEWTGKYLSTGSGIDWITGSRVLHIDAVSSPKSKYRAYVVDQSTDETISGWRSITNNPPNLSPRKRLRVWFLMDKYDSTTTNVPSHIGQCSSVSISATPRYYGMIGDGS